MSRESQYQELRLEVERCEARLVEARKVFDRQGPEAKEVWRVRNAEKLLELAQKRLSQPIKVILTEAEKAELEERRQARREPPSLQALVLAHAVYDDTGKMIGGYERITPAAWARLDAEMAEWKAKIREGKFDAKIW